MRTAELFMIAKYWKQLQCPKMVIKHHPIIEYYAFITTGATELRSNTRNWMFSRKK